MSSKSLFTSFALAALLFFGALASSFGQNPDICKPDCMGSNFGATQTTVVTLPGGCVVKVKYATRLACGVWNDLGIISVEPLTWQCGFFTLKQILDFTTLEMLEQNPMNFPTPGIDSCTTQWRVVNGACWKDTVTCDGDSILVPCNLTACCLSSYRICTDSLGNRTATKNGAYSPKACDSTDPHCIPVCNDDPFLTAPEEPGLSSVHIDELHSSDAVIIRRDPVGLPASVAGGTGGTVSAASGETTVMKARE